MKEIAKKIKGEICPIQESTISNGASCACKKTRVAGCKFTPSDMKLFNGVKVITNYL